MESISVILNSLGDTAPIWGDACRIQVFTHEAAGWEARESIPIRFDRTKPFASLRGEITEIAEKLGDAKILVGQSISGLAYQIFDRMGFQVIETDRFSPRLLDRIWNEIGEADRRRADEEATVRKAALPRETEIPGQFFLSLIELQQKSPDISSKMALQPFFDTTPFDCLTVLCRHLPPWLEPYISGKGWHLESQTAENGAEQVTVFTGCFR
jgi:Fe-only nitrogenase accessory protein AnfO